MKTWKDKFKSWKIHCARSKTDLPKTQHLLDSFATCLSQAHTPSMMSIHESIEFSRYYQGRTECNSELSPALSWKELSPARHQSSIT